MFHRAPRTRILYGFVIGAGFAGLRAAQELVAMGRSVILLEAKDRVGGRVKRAEVAGRVTDVGGQWAEIEPALA